MPGLTLEDCLPRVGTDFEVGEADGGVILVLEEATGLPASVRAEGSFRLQFRGPPQPVLPQAIYTLQHEDAAFEIFIVPVKADAAGVEYEAIFN
jgi:hypothetical protein